MNGPTAVEPGEMIAGRFRIERAIAVGGMAEVFEATDVAGGNSVAVKLLKPGIAGNAEAVERLRREGEMLMALQHPAIVAVDTFGKLPDGRLFIVMELLHGETLGAKIRREGQMEPADLAPVIAGSCAGLSGAHAHGIVHRDLKPDNIFLVDGEDGPQVKLLDFGISKVTGSDKLTQTGEVLGTPRYMAPEQLSAERDLDGRTDVYALGVIAYEALAGSPPFLASTATDLIVAILHGKSAPLRSFRPDLSPALEAVISRAMARAREARYATAEELAGAFAAAAGPGRACCDGGDREGMSTALIGSMPGDVGSEGSSGRRDDATRPGTFSAFVRPVVAAVVEAAPAQGARATRAPASRSRPRHSAGHGTAILEPEPRRPVARSSGGGEPAGAPAPRGHGSSLPGVPHAPSSEGAPPVARRRRRPPAGDSRHDARSATGGRIPLVVGGMVAGALSAGLAILLLKACGPAAEPRPPVQDPGPVSAADPADGGVAAADAGASPHAASFRPQSPPPPGRGGPSSAH